MGDKPGLFVMVMSLSRWSSRWLAALLFLLAIVCLPVAAALRVETGTYSFHNVADTTRGRFEQIYPAPSIDNAGTVVFTARLSADEEGIFAAGRSWYSSLVTLVDTRVSSYGYLGNLPAVDRFGTVVFTAGYRRGGTCVATVPGRGGPIVTVAATGGPSNTRPLGMSSMNRAGQIVFFRLQDDGLEGIFVGDNRGGPMTKVVDNRGRFYTFGSGPAIDDSGAVVFYANTRGGGWGLYRVQHPGDKPSQLAAAGGEGVGPKGFFSMSEAVCNAQGALVFHGDRYEKSSSLYKIQPPGGALVKVVDLAGSDYRDFYGWSINDRGRVVFNASGENHSAIFAGPDFRNDRVVGTGDKLFGFPVSRVWVAGHCINETGAIAFTYRWADERGGVAVATPWRWSRWTTLLLVCSAGLLGGSVFLWMRSGRAV